MSGKRIQNTSELHSRNKKEILAALKRYGELTRREIAVQTSLSFATVSSLVNSMEESQLIRKTIQRASSGGRMPTALILNPESWTFLVINLSFSGEIRMAVANLSCQNLCNWSCNLLDSSSYEETLRLCAAGFEDLLTTAGIARSQVLRAAAAIPGAFDARKGVVVNSTIPAFENRALDADLESVLGLAVSIANESNLMALACMHDHSSTVEDLVFLYIGEGLGVGFATDRALESGPHCYGGEISHMPIGPAGYRCSCGHTGCAETELSIPGFIRKYNDFSPDNPIPNGLHLSSAWNEFLSRAADNDAAALRTIVDNGHLLGTLASVLFNLLDPQEVILGGEISAIADRMLPYIQEAFESRMTIRREGSLPIRIVTGHNRLILAGCAELAFSHWNP